MTDTEDADFVDQVYAAALDERRWAPVIERFADLLGGSNGFLSAFDIVSGQGPMIASRCDPKAVDDYNIYYAGLNLLNHVEDPDVFLSNWRVAILTDDEIISKEIFVRTEYYNDFVLPSEGHSTMMLRLGRNGRAP